LVLVFDFDGLNYDKEIAFAQKHFDLVIVENDKNLGPGLSREKGLRSSDSKYVMFADSDDYFYGEGLKKILDRLDQDNFDILFSSFRYEKDGEVKVLCNVTAWLHGKIYRRDFLERNNIHFGDFRTNEDNGFNQLCLLYGPRVVLEDTLTYVYRDNPDSVTRKNRVEYKFSGLESFAASHVWGANEYLAHCEDCNYASVAQAMYCTLLAMYFYYLEYFRRKDRDKLLAWSKDALVLYLKYEKYFNDSRKETIQAKYSEAYPNATRRISFDDFIMKIKELP
jgi:glycosyltransferase involved in cell wall biosynthesis